MRTSLDFPDPVFRHLKARAALEGVSLRDLVLSLIERGLNSAAPAAASAAPRLPPSVRLGAPLALKAHQLTNATLSQLMHDD